MDCPQNVPKHQKLLRRGKTLLDNKNTEVYSMKKIWKSIFMLAMVAAAFLFCGCTIDTYEIWEVLNDHEERLTKIEGTLKDYNSLRDSIDELGKCKGKVEELETVVNQLKEEQKELKSKIDNISGLPESELEKLNDDISKLNNQIQGISSFIDSVNITVKPMLFKNRESKSIIAFIINNGMIVYVAGSGNTLSSEIYEDVNVYTYFVNGQRCLTFDGTEIDNYPNKSDLYYPKIEDYFGLEICSYIAKSYSELLKDIGYKVYYGFENPENSIRYFFCRPLSSR